RDRLISKQTVDGAPNSRVYYVFGDGSSRSVYSDGRTTVLFRDGAGVMTDAFGDSPDGSVSDTTSYEYADSTDNRLRTSTTRTIAIQAYTMISGQARVWSVSTTGETDGVDGAVTFIGATIQDGARVTPGNSTYNIYDEHGRLKQVYGRTLSVAYSGFS